MTPGDPTHSAAPVTAHLEDWVRRRVSQVGLVYWLDRDGLYTDLVDDLRRRHREGTSPVPVVALRGSYLEVMLELEGLFDTADPSPLLLHLPGHHEESVRATPLLELVRAGKRLRVGLETLVSDAATGRVRPDALRDFLASKPTDLAAADAWLAGQLAQRSGGIGVQLELMTPEAALDQLLRGGQLAQRVKDHPADRDGLWTWLEVKLGVDAAWRADSPTGDTPRDIAAVVTEWALCVEYVHDLAPTRAPRIERLVRLRSLPAAIAAACSALAAHLRERHPDRYERLAREVEDRLGAEAVGASPEDLGRIDTFPFEEDAVLEAAIAGLRAEAWGAVRGWATERLSGGSFWLRERPRREAWELLLAAVDLGAAIAAAGPELAIDHSHEAAVARYVERGAAVDRAHRKIEQERWSKRHADLPHAPDLRAALDELRQVYRSWADAWARGYTTLCEGIGFPPRPTCSSAPSSTTWCAPGRPSRG